MTHLLDTAACIVFMRNKASKTGIRLHSVRAIDVAICSIVKFELLAGAEQCLNPVAERQKIAGFAAQFLSLPFDDDCAGVAATIRVSLEQQGKSIGPNDTLIAAIAVRHNLIVVTTNVREFQRVPGLRVENWEVP
jgi:tRNA(fMet)-specific endonuclease VapC